MRAACLTPLERAVERRPGRQQRPAQIEGVRQIDVAREIGSYLQRLLAFPHLVEPPETLAQASLGADDAAALGHQVAQRPLQRASELLAAPGEQLVDLARAPRRATPDRGSA